MYWFLLLSLGIACLEVTVNSLSEPAQHLWSVRVKDVKPELWEEYILRGEGICLAQVPCGETVPTCVTFY